MADTIGISDDRDLLLNQLAGEFVARHRRGERPSLEDYCREHPRLADDIRSLFPAMVALERAKADAGAEFATAAGYSPPVTLLGDFQLLREVGRGGMGVVYEAEQISLGRRVALKLLPAEVFRDPIKKRRFEREAKAAAKLHHSNIVPVHGVGEHDGTPYYVMQFISGLGLDVVIDELCRYKNGTPGDGKSRGGSGANSALSIALARSLVGWQEKVTDGASHVMLGNRTMASADQPTPLPLSVPQLERSSAVSLNASSVVFTGLPGSKASGSSGKKTTYWESVAKIGVQVSEALAYAHKQGILHRDIKPANLLLDLEGVVWVTDFGLAKGDDSDNLTRTGDLLGTLRYMPPEAFEGKSDARGDVYSLGLTLFEMVALRPAYDVNDKNRLIRQVTSGDLPVLRRLRKDAPRDLVTIVEKACEKDPARRYQTADKLADDLQRYLDGRPITARRATEIEKLRMWARRRPAIAALMAALLLCLTVGAVVSTMFGLRAEGFARAAADREREATVARDAAKRNAAEATESRNAAARQASALLLDKGIEDARKVEPGRALHLFVQALRTLPADDSKSVELERLIRMNLSAWSETVPALEHILPTDPHHRVFGQQNQIAINPDATMIAMSVGDCEYQCFQTDNGRPAGPVAKLPGWIGRSIFAADGKSIWVETSNQPAPDADGWLISRIDPKTGRSIQKPIPTRGTLLKLIVTPDGRHLVGAVNGLHPKDTGPAANAQQARQLRTAEIVVWDTTSGDILRQYDVDGENPGSYLGLAPTGDSVTAWIPGASGRLEGKTFTLIGNEKPKDLGQFPAVAPSDVVLNGNIYFRDDMRSAIVIKGGQIYHWSEESPSELSSGVPTPFLNARSGMAPDGRAVVGVKDGRLFDIGAWPPRATGATFPHPGWLDVPGTGFGSLQFSNDGKYLATSTGTAGFDRRWWRLPHPPNRQDMAPHDASRHVSDGQWWGTEVKFDPQATCAIVRGDYVNVRIIDLVTGGIRETNLRHSDSLRHVVVYPGGKYFATGSNDGTARVWETATGHPAGPLLPSKNHVAALAFSPDGQTLVTGDYGPSGLVKFWDWRSGKESRPALVHDDIVLETCFSPNGHYLVTIKMGDWTGKAEFILWEVATGKPFMRVPQINSSHRFDTRISFRHDSQVMVSRNSNGMLTLWQIPTGRILGEKLVDGSGVARFSPNGRIVAAAERSGVRILDGENLAPLPGGYLPCNTDVHELSFSPDSAFLLTGSRNGSAQLWDLRTCKPIGPPTVLIGAILGLTFTPDGKTCVCVAADGTVRRWPVPAPVAEANLDRLADRVTLMTGQRMDVNQGLDFVSADEWRALRTALVGDGSTALAAPRTDADWHDTSAADAEQDGDAFGAEWHLERLAKLRPNDWVISARRAKVLRAVNRVDEADKHYAIAHRLAPSAQVVADWHRLAATTDESTSRLESARWNLDRAIALTPEDWTLYSRRALLAYKGGQHHRAAADIAAMLSRGADDAGTIDQVAAATAESGDWKRATKLFASITNHAGLTLEHRYHMAIANLQAGDYSSFRRICADVGNKTVLIGSELSRGDARRAAMIFALHGDSTDDWNKPLAWIDHALAGLAAEGWTSPALIGLSKQIQHSYFSTRGTLLYRAGRFDEAVKTLRDSLNHRSEGAEYRAWVFLALAEHRLGHHDAAKTAAATARATQAKTKITSIWDKAEIELLAAELDAAVPRTGTP